MIYKDLEVMDDCITYFSRKAKTYEKLEKELSAYIRETNRYASFQYLAGLKGPLTERVKKKSVLAAAGLFATWQKIKPAFDWLLSHLIKDGAGSSFVPLWLIPAFISMYILAAVLVKGIGYLGYLFFGKRIEEHVAQVVRASRRLYAHYDGFYDTYGYECPLPSYQFCDPRDLVMLRDRLLNGASASLEDARAALYESLHHYTDFLKELNKRPFRGQQGPSADTGKDSRLDEERAGNASPYREDTESFFTDIERRDLQSLKKAYRRLAKEYHPDSENGDPEKFIKLRMEYESLLQGFQTA